MSSQDRAEWAATRQEIADVRRERDIALAGNVRHGVWGWYAVGLILAVLILGGMWQLHEDNRTAHGDSTVISQNQVVVNDSLMESRAVGCSNRILNDQTLGDQDGVCFEPGVLKYYNPSTGELLPDPDGNEDEIVVLVSTYASPRYP